jgi:hypothetical protein
MHKTKKLIRSFAIWRAVIFRAYPVALAGA